MPSGEDFQQTTDDGLDRLDTWPDELAPAGGWDNATDITHAKTMLAEWRHTIQPGKHGEEVFFNLAEELRAFGIHPRTATDLIHTITKPECHSKVEVRAVVKNCYRVMRSPAPGVKSYAKPLPDRWDAPDEDDDSWLEGGNRTDFGVWPSPLLYDKRDHATKNADVFLIERPQKLLSSGGQLYTLGDDRIWTAIEDRDLEAEIFATDPSMVLGHHKIRGMVQSIHLARHSPANPFDWIEQPAIAPATDDLIIFNNGLLDFATGELQPHTGQFFATGTPDFAYQPGAQCPLWLAKLDEWLHTSFHPTLQEFMGYAMTPDTRYEVLLALIGAPRGGKGTISHITRSLIGPAHYISRTLNDFGNDFGLQGCLDKRLILIPDAADTDASKRGAVLERIKSITGNDPVSVNQKHKPVVTTRLPAKIMIVANRHPKLLDDSGALAAREVVISFERSFIGREDRDLRTKLDAELPGIANWALQGLRRLRANGGRFTIGERGRAASRALAESQSPALRFANACLIVTGDPNDYAPTDAVYDAYRYWADQIENLSGRERRNCDDFKHDLIAALQSRGVEHTQRRWHNPERPKIGKGKRRRGFFGFKMRGVT